MLRILVIFLSFVVLGGVLLADPPLTAEQRFAQWQRRIDEIDKCSSVLVHETTSNEDPDDKTDANYSESFYRRISSTRTGRRRLDQVVIGESNSDRYYVSILDDRDDVFYKSMGNKIGHGLREYTDRRHREARLTRSLLAASLQNHTGAMSGSGGEMLLFTKGRILSEFDLQDGRRKVVIVPESGLSMLEVLFGPEPDWAPVLIRGFLNPGKRVDSSSVTLSQCREWKHFFTTSTEWKKLTSGYVPSRIVFQDQSTHAEVEFLDWRFGDEVDQSLLDPAKFTTDGITASVDFDSWINAFESAKAKATDKGKAEPK